VRCDEPAFVLFGISMAGYNLILALALALFTLRGALRSRA
jgi:disulfide bond formation protein DsbB